MFDFKIHSIGITRPEARWLGLRGAGANRIEVASSPSAAGEIISA
jgi:hypothetical protein